MWKTVTRVQSMSCRTSASVNAYWELPVAITTRARPRSASAVLITSAARSAAADPMPASSGWTSTVS